MKKRCWTQHPKGKGCWNEPIMNGYNALTLRWWFFIIETELAVGTKTLHDTFRHLSFVFVAGTKMLLLPKVSHNFSGRKLCCFTKLLIRMVKQTAVVGQPFIFLVRCFFFFIPLFCALIHGALDSNWWRIYLVFIILLQLLGPDGHLAANEVI